MPAVNKKDRLSKELTLFDVYAISTGAMFSSGFFLLPGLASADAGPAVILAYFIGGIMVLPAMLSASELATAMPRAGGPYYFLDRSLGPMIGTVGGLGTWFALIFKSAFALIGMGAYLSLYMDVPIKPIAVSFALLFMVLNMVGVKKSGQVQGLLVVALVGILLLFVTLGLFEIFSLDTGEVNRQQLSPFMPFGFEGLIATVGLIFVSYAGLTQVASVAEEIKNPDRNIPLGMILSLMTATVIYVLGVYIMVALLDPNELREDLTPVASAANAFMDWLPYGSGLLLVVIAAIAAFASTGNAGIMSAARYPFAMARDKLIWNSFSKVSRFDTPSISITVTTGIMILFILLLDVADIAKLASAFMLLIFGFLNVAVIIMRESRIEEYDPGFRSPLYPWVQISGIIITIWLIAEMGWISILFTAGMVIACIIYYYQYAKDRVDRQGAIYHVHARLGEMRYEALEREMRGIMREKGLREEDPYEQAIGRAAVLDIQQDRIEYSELIEKVSSLLSERLPLPQEKIVEIFSDNGTEGAIPIGKNTALKHARINLDIDSEIVLVRVRRGVEIEDELFEEAYAIQEEKDRKMVALIFLISSKKKSGQHLRILAHLSEMIDSVDFSERWRRAKDEADLREILLRDERFIHLPIGRTNRTEKLIGKRVKELDLPGESLITIIKRHGQIIFPHGNTVIEEGDELSIIGEKADIDELKTFVPNS